MKNPLHYQLSEYDCGPTSVLNAISFLFPREEIPPEVIRNVMLYCLDGYNEEGIQGKSGTSMAAMMFLCNWLNGFCKTGRLPITTHYLSGRSVYIGAESYINDALMRGGCAVVRLFYDVAHYVLLTGIEDGMVRLFDPYFEDNLSLPGITFVQDHPTSYNRLVPEHFFNRENFEVYAFGPYDMREAVILFNNQTAVTPEKSIEYFI